MKRRTLPARLALLLLLTLVLAVAVTLVLVAADTALSVWARLREAPWPFTAALALLLALLLALALRIAWWLLKPAGRRSPAAVAPPSRGEVEARAAGLEEAQAVRDELTELDRRAATATIHVALFGEINAGKSSLLRAFAPNVAAVADVLGGSTRQVSSHPATLADGTPVVVSDLPGLNQAGDLELAAAARAEALRSHVVVYVCDGDLGRRERAELDALAELDKPLLIALNKRDRYRDSELAALTQRLATTPGVDRVVAISAGGMETRLRRERDGSERSEEVLRPPRIEALGEAIRELAAVGFDPLESRRSEALLRVLDRHLDEAESERREQRAAELVRGYTRRAVVGALAAVAPGTDLVIQGALATALLRSLGRVYDVPVRDLDADAFLARAGGTVRTSASITLAIAGNALKAFPGLGTLAGGLIHALAYGLIFDALGRAVAQTLAEQRSFDADRAAATFASTLKQPDSSRLRALATLALEEVRARSGRDGQA